MVRGAIFVKNRWPSAAPNVPCTTTTAGLSDPADCTEIAAAWTYPADDSAQARIRNRIDLYLSGTGGECGHRAAAESLIPGTALGQRSKHSPGRAPSGPATKDF